MDANCGEAPATGTKTTVDKSRVGSPAAAPARSGVIDRHDILTRLKRRFAGGERRLVDAQLLSHLAGFLLSAPYLVQKVREQRPFVEVGSSKTHLQMCIGALHLSESRAVFVEGEHVGDAVFICNHALMHNDLVAGRRAVRVSSRRSWWCDDEVHTRMSWFHGFATGSGVMETCVREVRAAC